MIRSVRGVNSNVIVLVTQVIPSGKSPKYELIPELNTGLGAPPLPPINQSFRWCYLTMVAPFAGEERVGGILEMLFARNDHIAWVA
jgi:hypothetical protein